MEFSPQLSAPVARGGSGFGPTPGLIWSQDVAGFFMAINSVTPYIMILHIINLLTLS